MASQSIFDYGGSYQTNVGYLTLTGDAGAPQRQQRERIPGVDGTVQVLHGVDARTLVFVGVLYADLGGGANDITIDAAAEDDVVHYRAYFGSLRYIKAFVDFTGTHTNGIPISAVVVKSYRRHATTS